MLQESRRDPALPGWTSSPGNGQIRAKWGVSALILTALTRGDHGPDGRPSFSRRVIADSLTLIREHLDMEVAFVGRFAQGRRWFEYVDADAGFCPIEVGASDPLESTYCARVADGRIPELIPDTAELESLQELEATTGLPVGSHVSVPMRRPSGKAFGTLCAFSREADPDLRERDLRVMHMFADLIAPHLQFLIQHERSARAVRARIDKVVLDGGPQIALQPIVDILSGEVYGVEALSRFPAFSDWNPERWFREAHLIGDGVVLEMAAVGAALEHLAELPHSSVMSVNVSAYALVQEPDIARMFLGDDAPRLILELTEHSQVQDYNQLEAVLTTLRRAGVRIAVDDAGSGYAGLEHILRLRPEVLKLDRVLVDGLTEHSGRRAMCQAMTTFAAETHTLLIAEGVETEVDLTTLRDLGMVYAQGYYLGRPAIPDGRPALRALPR